MNNIPKINLSIFNTYSTLYVYIVLYFILYFIDNNLVPVIMDKMGKVGVRVMVIKLFDLVYKLLEEVEKQKGNIPREEVIAEKATYILEHSIAEYNSRGLYLRDFSMIGVKDSKEIEVQPSRYMLFTVSGDYKKWELQTLKSLGEIEWEIRNTEVTDISVVMFDGVIKDYNLVNEERVIWKSPVFTVEWEEDGEDKQELIYDRVHLEEVIIEKVNEKSYRLRVFDILRQVFLPFQVFGTLYSSQDIITAPTVLWGYIDSYIEDKDEVIW